MQRFFLDKTAQKKQKVIISDKKLINQICKVLRAKEGDEVIVLFNDGLEHICAIETLSKTSVVCKIIEETTNKNELDYELNLYLSLPKSKELYERIIQKCCELGVKNIFPLRSERSTAKYPILTDRIASIIRESCEQAERGNLLVINNIVKPEDCRPQGISFVGDSFNKKATPLKAPAKKDILNLFIGPEGGFSEKEIEIFEEKGVKSVSFGNLVMRVETAVVYGVSVLRS